MRKFAPTSETSKKGGGRRNDASAVPNPGKKKSAITDKSCDMSTPNKNPSCSKKVGSTRTANTPSAANHSMKNKDRTEKEKEPDNEYNEELLNVSFITILLISSFSVCLRLLLTIVGSTV